MSGYRKTAYLYLLITALLWGIATPVIKFTLQGLEPFSFLFYRFFISFVIASIYLGLNRKALNSILRHVKRATLYSLLAVTVSLGLLFLGLEKTTVLDSVLITAVTPLLSAFFGYKFLNEHITNQEKLGIAVAFLGTLLIITEPLLSKNMDSIKLSGNLLVTGYLIANAYSSVEAKKLVRKNVNSLALANFSFIVGFITFIPLLLFTPLSVYLDSLISLDISYHAGVFYMAIFSGTIAYALWLKGQKSIEISEAGVFAYLIPVFAAPLAVLWLGESITPLFVIGAIVISIGVFVAEIKSIKFVK